LAEKAFSFPKTTNSLLGGLREGGEPPMKAYLSESEGKGLSLPFFELGQTQSLFIILYHVFILSSLFKRHFDNAAGQFDPRI
jgi:hypothetical protein